MTDMTTDSSPDESLSSWLRLREPVDHASRSVRVLEAALAAVARLSTGAPSVRVLDLATGAGSNLRYLIERLPATQEWLVVDRSPVLLRHLLERTAAWGEARGYQAALGDGHLWLSGPTLQCDIRTCERDLTTLDGDQLFEGRHLVTASALLDLVSVSWLRNLAGRCRDAGAAALFTITYDGRTTSSPEEPEDALVLELFNRHQHTDKGLDGDAAGPDSAEAARRAFADAGFETCTDTSDWVLDADHPALQRELIAGWAHAAIEMDPEQADVISPWLTRRLVHVNAASSRVRVGHQDLAAWLR